MSIALRCALSSTEGKPFSTTANLLSLLLHPVVDSWSSGKVTSNISQNVHLDAPLEPDTKYSWTVRYTDKAGAVSDWADNATFTTAPASWKASWIQPSTPSMSFLARKVFTLPAGAMVVRASVSCVGLG